MKLRTIAQGFGVAILLLLLRVWPILSPRHSAVYHSFLPMQSLVWGILIDVVVVTLFAALLFAFLEKGETGLRGFLWAPILAWLAPVLAADVAAAWQTSLSPLYARLLFYGILLGALALRMLRPPAYQQAVRGARFLLLILGVGLAWMLPELLYIGLRTQPHDEKVPATQVALSHGQGIAPSGGGRIVWLLFDELSYDQAFEHRFPGLAMPAFDQLKSESLSFSDLQPAGYHTERIVPSFFLGHVVNDIRSNLDGEPSIQLAGEKGWQAFDAHATLFGDAQRLGWTAGVVGWYNPYCRILAGTLNYCFWRVGDGQWTGTTPDNSALKNAMVPLFDMMPGEMKAGWQHKTAQEEKHASDLAALMPQAEALIRDQSIGFVFIHLPVPHPPGIYDRRPGHQRITGTYIDNLALADRTLAELMGVLNATTLAPKTTVIVCSDHSWRIPLWRPTPQWSKEEERASGGRFDTRPVLMIHLPGQQAEHDVTAPFDELRIHGIIEHLLRGQEPGFDNAMLAGGGAFALKP